MAEKDFDNFDGFADDYRAIHNESIKFSGADSDYFSEHKITEIRKNETGENLTILDLGCGDGNSAGFVREHFADSKYFGIDVSEESIRIAAAKNIPDAQFQNYNGFDIPFADNSFDVVFIACVLHHVNFEHHQKVLSEVKRVLKPAAKLYIFEHNPFNPVTRRVVNACPFDEDAVLLSPSYTKKMLRKLDYKNVLVNFIIFFPRTALFEKFIFAEEYLKRIPLGGQYYTVSTK